MGEAHVRITEIDGRPVDGPEWTTDDDGTHHTVDSLTFARVHDVNGRRAGRWHPGFPTDQTWTNGDWSNALSGESGELLEAGRDLLDEIAIATGRVANTVKKIRRYEDDLHGALDPDLDALREAVADEMADVFCYLDLLSSVLDVDLAAAIVDKFNRVSERQGFPERLP